MIRDYQAIMKTWFPKGKQRIIPTYGKHEGVKLVGILDYETGHVYVEEHKKYDAEVFLQFLKNVLSQYQDGKIVIILDNAKIVFLSIFVLQNDSRCIHQHHADKKFTMNILKLISYLYVLRICHLKEIIAVVR